MHSYNMGINSKGLLQITQKRKIWMTMHGLLCDVTVNATWRYIQDGGLDIFNALL
jgi:hypothetical protein